ncbi:mCG11475, isoform CRA_b, partial [Mus musculus]
ADVYTPFLGCEIPALVVVVIRYTSLRTPWLWARTLLLNYHLVQVDGCPQWDWHFLHCSCTLLSALRVHNVHTAMDFLQLIFYILFSSGKQKQMPSSLVTRFKVPHMCQVHSHQQRPTSHQWVDRTSA